MCAIRVANRLTSSKRSKSTTRPLAIAIVSVDKIALQLMGPVTVRRAGDSTAMSRLTQPRHLALLCYLALAKPRGLHSRDSLIALLWPEHDGASGRQALRNALHGVRRALGSEIVVTVGDNLVGLNSEAMRCDGWTLEERRGDERRGAGSDELTSAPGDPFEGFHVSHAPAFEDWLARERDRLRQLASRRAHDQITDDASAQSSEPNANATTTRSARPLHQHDAHSLYLRGNFLFLRAAHNGDAETLAQSRRFFERALGEDPSYAPALAGLANFYAVTARRGDYQSFHATFAQTIELSHRALAIDASLAVPHVHFGVEAMYLRDDLELAGKEFECAVALDPLYAEAHRFCGVWYSLMCLDGQALSAMQEAVRLEPDIVHMQSSLAAAQLAVGDAVGAEVTLRAALAAEPGHGPSRDRLLRLLERQGRYDDAMHERRRAPIMPGQAEYERAFASDGDQGYRYAREQELRMQAAALEARLTEGGAPTVGDLFAPPVLRLVAMYAQLGETKRAKAWQLQASAQRPALSQWFAALPELRA